MASAALILAGVIGGTVPIISKLLFRELSPLSVLFFSITIMLVVLLPLSRSFLNDVKKHWRRLILFGLLWTGNVTLFIIGVKNTTAVSSQVLYAGVPILVLIEHAVTQGERIVPRQVVGILLGFIGVFILALGSLRGMGGLGSFGGNLTIFVAAFLWASYLVVSKRFSEHIRPMVLTIASALVGWGTALVLLLSAEGVEALAAIQSLSLTGWMLLLLMGFAVRAGMILLYNWGIKHGSSVAAGSMVYVSTITSAIIAPVILGESLTLRLIIAAALLFVGVFLTTTYPLVFSHKKS